MSCEKLYHGLGVEHLRHRRWTGETFIIVLPSCFVCLGVGTNVYLFEKQTSSIEKYLAR